MSLFRLGIRPLRKLAQTRITCTFLDKKKTIFRFEHILTSKLAVMSLKKNNCVCLWCEYIASSHPFYDPPPPSHPTTPPHVQKGIKMDFTYLISAYLSLCPLSKLNSLVFLPPSEHHSCMKPHFFFWVNCSGVGTYKKTHSA